MADKIKYTVNRAMQDGAKSYGRGDTREMTAIDAAPLLATGALSPEGKDPAVREPAVKHTFGEAETETRDYVPATTDSVQIRRAVPANAEAPVAAKPVAAKPKGK